MTQTIHQRIDHQQVALNLLKTIAPPDDESGLWVGNHSRVIEVSWVRPEATREIHFGDEAGKAAARQAARDDAKAFLGAWLRRLKKLGRPVKTFGDTQVKVEVVLDNGWTVRASAEAEQVCEVVPVLDDEGQPRVEMHEVVHYDARTTTEAVPVTTKVCPPSLLAELEAEG